VLGGELLDLGQDAERLAEAVGIDAPHPGNGTPEPRAPPGGNADAPSRATVARTSLLRVR
jgi:hypothetical protein